MAAVFRHDTGGYLYISVVLFLLATSDWNTKKFAKGFLAFSLGITVFFVPVAAFFILNVDVKTLWNDLIVYPATVYPAARGLPIIDLSAGLGTSTFERGIMFTPGLLSVSAIAHYVFGRGGEEVSSKRLLLIMAIATLLFSIKGTVRTTSLHMAQPLILSIPLATFLAEQFSKKLRLRFIFDAPILIVWMVLFLFFTKSGYEKFVSRIG